MLFLPMIRKGRKCLVFFPFLFLGKKRRTDETETVVMSLVLFFWDEDAKRKMVKSTWGNLCASAFDVYVNVFFCQRERGEN